MFINTHNQTTGAQEEVRGTDGRLNVSSRSDSRSYYNSRDEGLAFALVYDFQDAANSEFAVYLKNTSSNKILVLSSAGLNAAQNARIKLHLVTGTAAGGNEIIPANENGISQNAADVLAREGGSAATGITGLTISKTFHSMGVPANGNSEMRFGDRVRLGQNQAIAIEYDEGTDGDLYGLLNFFFE